MTQTRFIVVVGISALFATACDKPSPLSPAAPSAAAASSALARVGAASVSCTVDIGATTRPLPALHELAAWINASLSASSLSCGQVRSLAAKLQHEVAALDALDPQDQNFAAACGVSTALLAELQALVSTGQLAVLTFPPPVPGAPTTVVGLATLTNGQFCAAAHG